MAAAKRGLPRCAAIATTLTSTSGISGTMTSPRPAWPRCEARLRIAPRHSGWPKPRPRGPPQRPRAHWSGSARDCGASISASARPEKNERAESPAHRDPFAQAQCGRGSRVARRGHRRRHADAAALAERRLDDARFGRRPAPLQSTSRPMIMCRNIKTLFNFEPPATELEIRDASLQFVRKLSGFAVPSKTNAAAFERAVEDIAAAARELVASLVTSAEPRDREIEAARARARSAARFGAL